MIKIGIIGYGTIATSYIKVLQHLSEYYTLCGIYDIDTTKAKKELSHVNIYESITTFLESDIDTIIISTPIHTHFKIASQCIKAFKHVIIEKPATISLEELDTLFELANDYNVKFYVAFHSSFAVDIEWYLANQNLLNPSYRLENIQQIESGFYDPYTQNGNLIEDRIALCGSYIDSGVNILSVCNRLVSLDNFTTQFHTVKQDINNVVYSSQTTYSNDIQTIVMHTGWDKGLNQKRTLLTFKNTDHTLLLDHTAQKVILSSDGKESILFEEDNTERLVNHYIGVFNNFMHLNNFAIHEINVKKIHELLLENA